MGEPKRKPDEPGFGAHPEDAEHVRRAFEQDARRRGRSTAVTPEQLRRWAETGEWPESSD